LGSFLVSSFLFSKRRRRMVYQDPGNPRRPDDYIDRNGDMG
jgi:hypothetical protein